ncbi:MAG: SDR family oxidoreductase, partial [Anaerolineales bacterium]
GPGSISFEMIRFMTELMPIVFGPLWLQNMSQPIAAPNVIDYLLAALETRDIQSRTFEIGGPDRMSYAELMLIYSRLRGLRRKYMTLPGIPLWFMALGVEWLTPVPAAIARPLVDGLQCDSLVQDESARHTFPHITLIGYEEAVNIAFGQLHPGCLEPVWKDCDRAAKFMKHEGFFIDHRCETVDAAPEKAFRVVSGLGGKNGWLYADWLWKLRGWLDHILGGPGLRGRYPHPNPSPIGRGEKGEEEKLKAGDVIDFYRIEAIENNRLLRLHSELKAPGEGWMEWCIETEEESTRISQTGFFAPRSFWGFAYWILLGPFHRLVFRGLIRAIARQSEL